ncbi:MAG: hypothetical protein RLN90_01565 [Balneolaceae bacterium]
MDTKKRHLEIKVWDYSFFSEFSYSEKLFYWFVYCHCDNVGVYQHNPKLAAFHCGEGLDLDSFISKMNTDEVLIEPLTNKKFWLPKFVQETWKNLSPNNNLGKSCYTLLVKHSLLDRFEREFPQCIQIEGFVEAIQNKEKSLVGLPIPKSLQNPGADLGLGKVKPGSFTFNNNISNNGNKDITTSTAMNEILTGVPNRIITSPEHVLIEDLDSIRRSLKIGVEQYVIHSYEFISRLNWDDLDWENFLVALRNHLEP